MSEHAVATMILVFAFPASILLTHRSLRGVLKQVRGKNQPIQYGLQDFAPLFFVLSIVLPAALQYTNEPAFLVGVSVCTGIYWWFGVCWATQAQLPQPWQRGIFLALLQPLACFGFLFLLAIPTWLANAIVVDVGSPFLIFGSTAALVTMPLAGCLSLINGFLVLWLAPKPDLVEEKAATDSQASK